MRSAVKQGHEVHFACPPNGELIAEVADLPIKLHLIDHLDKKRSCKPFFATLSILKREAFDRVHTHLFNADLFVLPAAWFMRVQERYSTVHGKYFYYLPAFRLRRLHYLALGAVFRVVYRFATNLIAPSNDTAQYLSSSQFLRVSSKKIRVQPNTPHVLVPALPRGTSKTAVYVANFDLIKGHRPFLTHLHSFFDAAPDWKVVFCGCGPEKEKIRKWIVNNGYAESVLFVDEADKAMWWLANAGFVVHPSLMECNSLALLEAKLFGKHIICFDVGGNSDLPLEKNDRLVRYPDYRKFIEEMKFMARKCARNYV